MKKKWYDLIRVIAVCLAVCAFCGCNNRPSAPIVLVDFPATAAEEVTLGSEYRLKIKTVKDENGKEYAVSAVVTDSKGQNVELTNGETFAVTDKDGYVIVYTANTGASPQTQTLTLTVIGAETPDEPIVLVDFPATATEEATLGSEYRLKIKTVKDENGKEYAVSAVVTDSKGQNVELTNGETFHVTDIGGYTIVYTANTGVSQQTQTLTLNVKDTEKPTIVISEPSEGVVGVEYTLPAISFSDMSGTIAESSVSLKFVGESETAVDITETGGVRKFTPEHKGEYKIVAYAKDQAGNERTEEKTFFVDVAMAANVVFDPDSIKAKERITPNTDVVTAVGTGDRSYISFSRTEQTAAWVTFSISPVYEISNYADYDLLSVWIYAAAEPNADNKIWLGFFDDIDYRRQVVPNEWVQVKLPMARFIEEMNGEQVLLPVNYNNSNSGNHKNLTEIRIGKIEALAQYRVNVQATEVSDTSSGSAVITVSGIGLPASYSLTVKDSAETVLTPTSADGHEYTFGNLACGTYSYTVSDGNNALESAEGTFTVRYASASHIILDTADASAVSQLTPAGSAAEIADTSVRYVPASVSERAYFEFKKASDSTGSAAWRKVKLDSRYAAAAYKYATNDYVSIWLRLDNATTKDISIGLFGKNTGEFGKTVTTNKWTEILLPANVFFDELVSASNCFYANFSTGGSQAGLTVYRIGAISVKYKLSVSVDKGNDLQVSESARNVSLTVVSSVQEPSYTLTLTNAEGTVMPDTQSGNEHTYSLPTGTYTYRLTANADKYVIPVAEGSFAIEYALDVHKTTVNQSTEAMGSATVTADFDGTASTFTLVVKNSADESMPVTVSGKTFTIENLKAGAYTYTLTVDNIVKTGTIDIGYDVAQYMLFDPDKPDSLSQWTPDKVTLTQIAATGSERAYLNITGSGWTAAQLSTYCHTNYKYDETDVVSMWLYLDTTDQNIDVKLGLFDGYQYRQFFRSHQWYEVIIPASDFFELIKTGRLLPSNFKSSGSAIHKNLQNIRVGAISIKKQAVTVDSSALYELSGNETERDVTINVTNNFATVTHTFTLKDASGATVQPVSSEKTGNVTAYTYRLQKGAYTYTVSAVDSAQGEQRYVLGFFEKFRYLDSKNWYVATRFASEITESVQVGNEYILVSAEESNYEVKNGGKLSSGTETSSGSAYTGNYVKAEKNAGGARWSDPKFKTALPLYNAYAEFDYIVIWVYEESDTADSTTNQAFFNTVSVVDGYNTKPKLENNVWHKITFSVSFLLDNALLAANNSFAATALFMNFDPVLPDGTVTNAADFPATKAVRIGNIYLEKAANANI